MREALDPWIFTNASYAVTIIGMLLVIAWSWIAMRRAERRREDSRRK